MTEKASCGIAIMYENVNIHEMLLYERHGPLPLSRCKDWKCALSGTTLRSLVLDILNVIHSSTYSTLGIDGANQEL